MTEFGRPGTLTIGDLIEVVNRAVQESGTFIGPQGPQGAPGATGAQGVPGKDIYRPTSIEAYGHSWPAGYGTTASKYGFLTRLAKALGVTLTNTSLTGGVAAGIASAGGVASLLRAAAATDLTAGPYISQGGLKLCAIGYNDYPLYHALTGGNALTESALRLAYSRLLAAKYVDALKSGPALNTPALSYSASFGAAPNVTVSSGLGYAYTTTNGDHVDFNLDAAYNGEAVCVVLPMDGAFAKFTATVTVDGVAQAALVTDAFADALFAASVAGATVCARIPAGVLSPGAHAVRVTMSGIANGYFALFGGYIIEGAAPLIVPSYPPRTGVAAGTGVNLNSEWSNARNQTVLAGFPTGQFIDLAPALTVERQWYDGGHPNNLGHGSIAALLLDAIDLDASAIGQMS